jgi:hypothetical protein
VRDGSDVFRARGTTPQNDGRAGHSVMVFRSLNRLSSLMGLLSSVASSGVLVGVVTERRPWQARRSAAAAGAEKGPGSHTPGPSRLRSPR